VIDAAGTIYVIGGYDRTYCSDVWVSIDGGADWTRAVWGTQWILVKIEELLAGSYGALEG
jgi:hypothetical protein